MAWRCDEEFKANLDKLTISLAKGASMGLVTYFTIKTIGIAHDNEWGYLATGWGAWYVVEMAFGVLLPIAIFAWAIRNRNAGLARIGAFITVAGIVLNRLNTALITFNWQLYQEIPHWREVIISLTIFAIYIVTYRFILYRLPILYEWKGEEALVPETVTEPVRIHEKYQGAPEPVGSYRSID
jgi:hypothetical protein